MTYFSLHLAVRASYPDLTLAGKQPHGGFMTLKLYQLSISPSDRVDYVHTDLSRIITELLELTILSPMDGPISLRYQMIK